MNTTTTAGKTDKGRHDARADLAEMIGTAIGIEAESIREEGAPGPGGYRAQVGNRLAVAESLNEVVGLHGIHEVLLVIRCAAEGAREGLHDAAFDVREENKRFIAALDAALKEVR